MTYQSSWLLALLFICVALAVVYGTSDSELYESKEGMIIFIYCLFAILVAMVGFYCQHARIPKFFFNIKLTCI